MDHQYRENGPRNIYSMYNQMRTYAKCFANKPKNYTLWISNQQNFEDPGKELAISVSKVYQSTAVQLHQSTLIRRLSLLYVCKLTTISAIRESLPISVRR